MGEEIKRMKQPQLKDIEYSNKFGLVVTFDDEGRQKYYAIAVCQNCSSAAFISYDFFQLYSPGTNDILDETIHCCDKPDYLFVTVRRPKEEDIG